MILKGYLFSLLYGVICLSLAFVAYKLGLDKKYTRKIVHILIGFEWLILYHYVGASIHFVAVCLIFTLLVTLTHISKTMPMISSDSDNSFGTVYYCISMTVMSVASLFIKDAILSFGVAVFCTSFGDGLAGVIGQSIKYKNPKIYANKTLYGTLANFACSFTTALIFVRIFDFNARFLYVFSIAALASVIELFVGFGLDNLALPLGVFSLSLLLLNIPEAYGYILPILITPVILCVVIKKKWLTNCGTACAVMLDIIVSLAFGNFGFIFIMIFLVGGSLMDKIKKHHRSVLKIEGSHSARSFYQVLANALAPAVCAILFLITHSDAFLIAFCVAVTEAFADTSASAFGAFSNNTFDIFKMKKCKKGLSGGMSLIGTFSSVIVCILMSLTAYLFTPITFFKCTLIAAFAFSGVMLDTFLGSVFQVKYMCVACGTVTEKKLCCDTSCKKYSGFTIIGNETVNLISSLIPTLLCALFFLCN